MDEFWSYFPQLRTLTPLPALQLRTQTVHPVPPGLPAPPTHPITFPFYFIICIIFAEGACRPASILQMSKFLMYLGLGMSIFFMFAAVFIVIYPPEHPQIKANKEIIAVCLFLYGVFRLYRSIRTLRGNGKMMQ